ncbi:hypothetical protein PG994_008067 [Apiospora phragmitis]|uniref:Uncharacterized protein n=1 Tax=Apiospora phragmitis TaxID=2905665 RepID=A0ABR1UUE9_9PEZI
MGSLLKRIIWNRNRSESDHKSRPAEATTPGTDMSGNVRRPVEEWPDWFDYRRETFEKAKEMAELTFDNPKLKKYIYEEKTGTMRRIIASGENYPAPLVERRIVEKTKQIKRSDNIRVLHLHFSPQDTTQPDAPRTMRITCEDLWKDITVRNYVELVRIRTTPRALLIALFKKYPTTSTILHSDCAQFAIRFLRELAKCTLYGSNNMSDSEFDSIVDELKEVIHVKDGSVGYSEGESRGALVTSDQSQEGSHWQ